MNEKAATLKVLRIFHQTGLVTRPEVGLMLDKTVGQIAGLCRDNNIEGWPNVSPEVRQLRTCCFLMTLPGAVIPKLCSKKTVSPEEFRCEEHVEAVYELQPKKPQT